MSRQRQTYRNDEARVKFNADSKARRDANRSSERCINEGKGIRGKPHGPRAPKLDKIGNVIGSYTRCAACVETHSGHGPNAGTKKRKSDWLRAMQLGATMGRAA